MDAQTTLFALQSSITSIPYLFLEIPEVERVCRTLLSLLLLLARRHETHQSFTRRKRKPPSWFVVTEHLARFCDV